MPAGGVIAKCTCRASSSRAKETVSFAGDDAHPAGSCSFTSAAPADLPWLMTVTLMSRATPPPGKATTSRAEVDRQRGHHEQFLALLAAEHVALVTELHGIGHHLLEPADRQAIFAVYGVGSNGSPNGAAGLKS